MNFKKQIEHDTYWKLRNRLSAEQKSTAREDITGAVLFAVVFGLTIIAGLVGLK
jgi:hypothetical protein